MLQTQSRTQIGIDGRQILLVIQRQQNIGYHEVTGHIAKYNLHITPMGHIHRARNRNKGNATHTITEHSQRHHPPNTLLIANKIAIVVRLLASDIANKKQHKKIQGQRQQDQIKTHGVVFFLGKFNKVRNDSSLYNCSPANCNGKYIRLLFLISSFLNASPVNE